MGRTVLVGVDGSDGAARAVAFATETARASGAELVLACIVEWSRYEFHGPSDLAVRHRDREREIEEARSRILGPAAAAARDRGMEPRIEVRHGHPAEELSALAVELGAEQIVTGRRGRSRIKTLLFGSIAGTLIQISTVPVTVVP